MPVYNRRSFLDALGTFSATAFLATLTKPAWSRNLDKALMHAESRTPEELAGDEDFWYFVQQSFATNAEMINLNNGGVSPAPKVVQEAMKRLADLSNEGPSYYMWRIVDQAREPLRTDLARISGCSAEEIAIHRNASEALETVIFGLDLKAGDEVVVCKYDYPNCMNAWKQREQREGIKLVWVELALPSEDNDYLVSQYTKAFTAKTKVVHVTHMMNWNGQILPVRRIADAAHQRGIEVIVDGAHTFAQLEFTIPATGADYFGTSLHKWLTAGIGTGMLYVRKDKIAPLYPLMAAPDAKANDIRKFENLGTRPFFIEAAIGKAINFYDMIGAARKEQRLFYLKSYWMKAVKDIPKVKFYTSMKPGFGCAIGVVGIEGKKPSDLDDYLWGQYRIHSVHIDWQDVHGVRITPNVYTTTKDLDKLITAIGEYAKA
ncbi:aminotransferase class V-fold PLP-dependent enzyme [Puia dinghuensis]|uniref:Cysteine desulfurase n=1 Tax=Puia dinghuensis TaxID=1792502 RepID=A0A8J2XVF8_9BACT|nr:aminotransferase class V-fold PLP-dependent enzyme [Puia dinghuensis]GGB15402.1 cysteine desulfurase [Puia dinghuensis]